MNRTIKYLISCVLFLSIIGNIKAQKALTLNECRSLALEYNRELKKAALQKEEALAHQKTARTAYLPALSAELSVLHLPTMDNISMPGYFLPTAESAEEAQAGNFSGSSDVWSSGLNLNLKNLALFQGGLTVNQPLYTGGKIKYSNLQTDAGVKISEFAYELKHSEVIEKTDEAFWNLVMIQSNIDLINNYIKMLTELEGQMGAMFEVGLQPASEKLKVSVQKNEAELNLMKAQNGLKVAKMYLNQILGQDLETNMRISYNITDDNNLIDLSDGIYSAAENRSELKILNKQKEISEYQQKIEKSEYLPQAGVSVQYTGVYVNNLLENVEFRPMIAAQVSVPLFSWGQNKHKQKAAQMKIEQAASDLQNTNELISLEVMQVKVQVQEAFESILIARKNIEEANESLDETKASFDVGLNTTNRFVECTGKLAKSPRTTYSG